MQTLSSLATRPYARPVQPPAVIEGEDAALARRILAATPGRDTDAEAQLCRRFAPRIRLFGLKRLRSEAAAADLAQDVLMLVLEKLRAGAVLEPERIAAFVLGVARQRMIDSRRNSGRRERLLETFALDLEPSAERESISADVERVRPCLDALPARERAVLVMTFYDETPADVLAAQLGLSTANVRVIRHRGLKHLRDCLEGRKEAQ
jgi:RNA polymerase sigma-70 factor (ECF subfamily)